MRNGKNIEHSLRIVWSSLNSHIPYLKGKDRRWHKRVICEYAEVIKTLCEKL